MQPRNVETMWENWGVRVDLKNCAYLSKNPGYAPVLLPGWDASPSQAYLQQYVAGTHFIHLGGERKCGVFSRNNTMAGTGPRTNDLQIWSPTR